MPTNYCKKGNVTASASMHMVGSVVSQTIDCERAYIEYAHCLEALLPVARPADDFPIAANVSVTAMPALGDELRTDCELIVDKFDRSVLGVARNEIRPQLEQVRQTLRKAGDDSADFIVSRILDKADALRELSDAEFRYFQEIRQLDPETRYEKLISGELQKPTNDRLEQFEAVAAELKTEAGILTDRLAEISPAGSPKRKRGRPKGSFTTDKVLERRIQEARKSGHYRTNAELAAAMGVPEYEVKLALDRARKPKKGARKRRDR